MSYFRNFPNIEVPINGSPVSVKDILRRVKVPDEVFDNEGNFSYYRLGDGENLKDVAFKQYGDPSLDWAIILFNNLLDPFYSTPLSTLQFEDFVESKYDGQSIFCSAVGSSLPFFLNVGSFDEGDFIAEKTLGSNSERVYTDGTKSGTIKSIDTSLTKLDITKQTGSFSQNDLIANRTQFNYSPATTVERLPNPPAEASEDTNYNNIPIGNTILAVDTLWRPSDNTNGDLVAWYQPSGIGSTQTNGLTGSGGVTLSRVNTWTNSAPNRSLINLSCVTADFMPILGENGYNGYQYAECNLSSIVSGNTQGSRMSFANSLGNFGITQHDFMICMMMQFKNADDDLGSLISIPSRTAFNDGSADRSAYRNRYLLGMIAQMNNPDPTFSGPVLTQRFNSLQTNPVDINCPVTFVPPRIRPRGKPNIVCFGRSGGGTGNAKPFFRINGQTH